MRYRHSRFPGLMALTTSLLCIQTLPAQPIELQDGDRVVFLGNTFIEREQRYGYIETALTSAWPDRKITFRNLGWSGDNVSGEARAYFGGIEDGYKHLIDHVRDLKPTVIFVSYGSNAAFEGEAGLDTFKKGLDRLLKDLKATGARLVLLGVLEQQDEVPGLPAPTAYNASAKLYSNLLKETAGRDGHSFVSLNKIGPVGRCLFHEETRGDETVNIAERHLFPITINNVHLSPLGYWRAASSIFDPVADQRSWSLSVKASGADPVMDGGATITEVRGDGKTLSFRSVEPVLPMPVVKVRVPEGKKIILANDCLWSRTRTLGVTDLKPGLYELRIDGKAVRQPQGSRSKFIGIPASPELAQAEELRQTIVKKNELFFHHYRPQNETYLRGFRKHEQGQNAKEIAQFNPLIEELERRIDELKKPQPHLYELVRIGEEKP